MAKHHSKMVGVQLNVPQLAKSAPHHEPTILLPRNDRTNVESR